MNVDAEERSTLAVARRSQGYLMSSLVEGLVFVSRYDIAPSTR